MYMYACICMYVYVCICMCVCMCVYVCVYVCICVYAYMYMYVCIIYGGIVRGKCPTQNGKCPGENCPGELSYTHSPATFSPIGVFWRYPPNGTPVLDPHKLV